MMSTRAQIRIEDLTEPVLTAAQQGAKDFGETLTLSFDEDELIAAAEQTAGVSGFASEEFRPRLRAYLAAIEGDSGLSGLGRLIQRRRAVQLLANRLLFDDLLRHYPEIHDVELAPPLIVVGLPRSGTTHLVNLLAADRRFRALPFWESQEPFARRGDGPGVDGIDPRFTRWEAEHRVEDDLMPHTKAMHDRFPAAIEEEVELLDVDFASYTLEWHVRSPAWRDFYLSIDQRGPYDFLRTVLQALTFLRGPNRWVLKSPQHLEQLPALTATFPDATIAFTHRDPVAVIQSAITMLAYGDRLRRHAVEPGPLAAYWVDRVERLLRACVRDRGLVPTERSIDVVFHEFMADDVGTVGTIYDVAGIEMTGAARRQLDGYLAANPRGKHGQVVYDLQGDFGLDPADVRRRFDFYFDRFPIRPEH
jgi:hypothetical protein